MRKKMSFYFQERLIEVVAISFSVALAIFLFIRKSFFGVSQDFIAASCVIAIIGFVFFAIFARKVFHFFFPAQKAEKVLHDPTIDAFQEEYGDFPHAN